MPLRHQLHQIEPDRTPIHLTIKMTLLMSSETILLAIWCQQRAHLFIFLNARKEIKASKECYRLSPGLGISSYK